MQSPESISPEEKLLKVIRETGTPSPDSADEAIAPTLATGGGTPPLATGREGAAPATTAADRGPARGGATPASASDDAATVPTTTVPRAPIQLKTPRHKAPAAKTAAPTVPPDAAAQAARSPGPAGGGPPPAPGRFEGIRTATGLLAAAAVILVFLGGWIAWAYVRDTQLQPALARHENGATARPEAPAAFPGPDMTPAAVDDREPVAEIARRFRERPLFAQPETAIPGTTDPPAAPRSDWEKYAREHLRLLGLSVIDAAEQTLEAIVTDTGTGAMMYLTVGESLTVDGTRLRVTSIGQDHLVISDDDNRMELK